MNGKVSPGISSGHNIRFAVTIQITDCQNIQVGESAKLYCRVERKVSRSIFIQVSAKYSVRIDRSYHIRQSITIQICYRADKSIVRGLEILCVGQVDYICYVSAIVKSGHKRILVIPCKCRCGICYRYACVSCTYRHGYRKGNAGGGGYRGPVVAEIDNIVGWCGIKICACDG
jgi:hypothetical protein